jgi:hypothetical protein
MRRRRRPHFLKPRGTSRAELGVCRRARAKITKYGLCKAAKEPNAAGRPVLDSAARSRYGCRKRQPFLAATTPDRARMKMKKMPPLFTIGYQQASQREVIAALQSAKVKLVVDTRAVAASRRTGFSKRMLAAGLDEAGIGYLHLQKLGTPPEGREAARNGDFGRLWKIYNKHLKTADARAALDELETILKQANRVCLLCYERNPEECHRKRIVEEMQKRTGQRAEHLFALPI